MPQPTLTNLAQRGAPCKPWAEWCRNVLFQHDTSNRLEEKPKQDVKRVDPSENRPPITHELKDEGGYRYGAVNGPLPSCTYEDDQLGEFLRLAGCFLGKDNAVILEKAPGEQYAALTAARVNQMIPLLNQLESAIILVERAHRLGEYAHYTETEAAPYMAAFLRGIGG